MDEKNGFFTTALYLKIHMELSLIAYQLTGKEELAKDIASECLITFWKQGNKMDGLKSIKLYLTKLLRSICYRLCKESKIVRQAEDIFIWQSEAQLSANRTFRIAQRFELLDMSRLLEPVEHAVLVNCLLYELDLPEIGAILKKPVPTIKNIRDRAIYQLKKIVLQKTASANGHTK